MVAKKATRLSRRVPTGVSVRALERSARKQAQVVNALLSEPTLAVIADPTERVAAAWRILGRLPTGSSVHRFAFVIQLKNSKRCLEIDLASRKGTTARVRFFHGKPDVLVMLPRSVLQNASAAAAAVEMPIVVPQRMDSDQVDPRQADAVAINQAVARAANKRFGSTPLSSGVMLRVRAMRW